MQNRPSRPVLICWLVARSCRSPPCAAASGRVRGAGESAAGSFEENARFRCGIDKAKCIDLTVPNDIADPEQPHFHRMGPGDGRKTARNYRILPGFYGGAGPRQDPCTHPRPRQPAGPKTPWPERRISGVLNEFGEGVALIAGGLSRLRRSMLVCKEILSIAAAARFGVHAIKGSWRLDNTIQSSRTG